jgi:predicted aspartyl protease
MKKIEWSRVDEYTFVYLVADLFRSLGFVDILIQGDGPDGGLDLMATELLSFAVQGAKPFRWGMQCKYSAKGSRRSVNDREISDVEGILRSDRYSTHDLGGYMLVTNRRISQNVIERLRGIDKRSPFRASYVDEALLSQLVSDKQKLMDKYFSALADITSDLGAPMAVGELRPKGGRPVVPIKIRTHNCDEVIELKAIIDTGAVMSVVPLSVIERFRPLDYSYRRVRSATGETTLRSVYLTISIGGSEYVDTEVLTGEFREALIGFDLLKQMTLVLDGPNGLVKLWKTES